jgi:hypothetical protein
MPPLHPVDSGRFQRRSPAFTGFRRQKVVSAKATRQTGGVCREGVKATDHPAQRENPNKHWGGTHVV